MCVVYSTLAHSHVNVTDILVPSPRDNLPRNVKILTANFHDRWPFDNGSVDLVHMRQLQYAVSQIRCSHNPSVPLIFVDRLRLQGMQNSSRRHHAFCALVDY
jgi:hypothetical protein